MTHAWQASELRSHAELAADLVGQVEAFDVAIEWHKVSETNKVHKVVHRMSREAQRQVLVPSAVDLDGGQPRDAARQSTTATSQRPPPQDVKSARAAQSGPDLALPRYGRSSLPS